MEQFQLDGDAMIEQAKLDLQSVAAEMQADLASGVAHIDADRHAEMMQKAVTAMNKVKAGALLSDPQRFKRVYLS